MLIFSDKTDAVLLVLAAERCVLNSDCPKGKLLSHAIYIAARRYVKTLRVLRAPIRDTNPDRLTPRGLADFLRSEVQLTKTPTKAAFDIFSNKMKPFSFVLQKKRRLSFMHWVGKSEALSVFEKFFTEDKQAKANAEGSAAKKDAKVQRREDNEASFM